MAPVRVDPDTYTAASEVFGSPIADGVFNAYRNLQDALGGSLQMSGSDPAGASWGTQYDQAAEVVSGTTQDVINGCYQLAGLLEQSGFNHGVANSASVPGGSAPTTDTTHWAGFSVSLGGFPTGSGATGDDTPSGWWLIEHTVGYVWPNGHQDRLRAAAKAWADAAKSITSTGWMVPDAVAHLSGQHSPEVADAVTACNAMKTHIDDLSYAYSCMSQACTDYANHIDEAHKAAIDELTSLLEWTIAIEAAGAVAGFFSLGIGEGVAQGVEAGRIAATASRVANIIIHLGELVADVVVAIGRVITRVVEISSKLRALLAARLSSVTAKLIEKFGFAAVKDGESAAVDALEFGTAPDTAFFWSGKTGGVGGDVVAGDIAAGKGGTTLEQLMESRGIKLPEWDPADPSVVQAWKDASLAYAEGASGTVRAVIGADLRAGNVWETVELPALKNNPFVTKIVQIDPATGVEKVIWTR
jgi:hypothetical protein